MPGRFGVAVFVLLLGTPALTEAQDASPAEVWVAKWGESWWERYHPDYKAWYPGGRTDRFHDTYVEASLKQFPSAGIADFSITNRQYLFDGDWFVVEWIYESTQASSGLVQRESTVAFGRIVDDHLKVWIEYFDDMVGSYQWIGAMPLYADDEEPYPWPSDTPLRREYRP